MTKRKKTPTKKTPTKAAKRPPNQNGTGPVAQVSAMAAEMGAAARPRDVIARCIEQGIIPSTARTQVSRWRAANK